MNTCIKRSLSALALATAASLSVSTAHAQQVYLSATNTNSPVDAGYLPIGYFAKNANGSNGFYCDTGRPYCAFNGLGYKVNGVSNTTPFVFNGGLFEATTFSYIQSPPLFLTFVGSDGTNTYTSAACTLSTTAFASCTSGFTQQLTSIEFVTSGGKDAAGNDGGYYLANDLAFNGPTGVNIAPEPSSVALLGTGLIGLVPMLRRKRNTL